VRGQLDLLVAPLGGPVNAEEFDVDPELGRQAYKDATSDG